MKYCPECKNAMIPQGNKLYCKVCKEKFEMDEGLEEVYVSKQEVTTMEEAETKTIKKDLNEEISERDRDSKEDFFGIPEEKR